MQRGQSNGCASFDSLSGIVETLRSSQCCSLAGSRCDEMCCRAIDTCRNVGSALLRSKNLHNKSYSFGFRVGRRKRRDGRCRSPDSIAGYLPCDRLGLCSTKVSARWIVPLLAASKRVGEWWSILIIRDAQDPLGNAHSIDAVSGFMSVVCIVIHSLSCRDNHQILYAARSISPARSPMITQGAIVLPVVTRGMIEPSATRRLSIP